MFARGFKSWCENVAIQQRRELKLQQNDPLDPRVLAKHLGIEVWHAEEIPGLDKKYLKILLEDDPDSWSAITLSVGATNLIILNSSHFGGRPASDLMHELSHILIGHEPTRAYVTEDGLLMLNAYDRSQEEEARWLAGCLLLPRDALLQIRLQRMNLKVAARKYGVSSDMLRYRLNVTGIDNQLSRVNRKFSAVIRKPTYR
jgi:Zn-dependent peptidase ImmA (M78 family)